MKPDEPAFQWNLKMEEKIMNEYNPHGKDIRFIDSHYKDLFRLTYRCICAKWMNENTIRSTAVLFLFLHENKDITEKQYHRLHTCIC